MFRIASRKTAQADRQGRTPLEITLIERKAPPARYRVLFEYGVFTVSLALNLLLNTSAAQTAARRSGNSAAKQGEATSRSNGSTTDNTAIPEIPPVLMTKLESSLCGLKVGDTLPAIELKQLGGPERELSKLYGTKATVVAFWRSDRRMTRSLLADLGPDVGEKFSNEGVNLVGIAVNEPADEALADLQKAGARFPNLLDADGKAFAQVGRDKLPRVYLVDPQGRILWFDIEYSLATRRELNQALRAVTNK